MSKKEYTKIKKLLAEAVEEFEQEAISKGINIMSEEYDQMVLELKRKLVKDMGFDWDDFRKADHAVRGIDKTKISFGFKDLR